MVFVVQSIKNNINYTFKDRERALDLIDLLSSKNSQLISDLTLLEMETFDEVPTLKVSNEIYRNMYEER